MNKRKLQGGRNEGKKQKITKKGSGTDTGIDPDIYDVCHADFPVSFGGSGRIR